MILEVEFRIPGPALEAFRQRVMECAPREREDCCPACGADRFHLLDALCDQSCWENRALAASIIRGCRVCRLAVANVLAKAREVRLTVHKIDEAVESAIPATLS